MFGWIPEFLFGHSTGQRIAELESENARLKNENQSMAIHCAKLQKDKADMQERLSAALAQPPFFSVAKDFEIGPKLYSSLVDKFYDKMEPILSREAFNMLLKVNFYVSRGRAAHSVAMVDTFDHGRVTAHEFHMPELTSRIQVMEDLPE